MNSFEEKAFLADGEEWRLLYCGKRLQNVCHSYGPHRRDDLLIYYVKEGVARLFVGEEEHRLTGGSIFVNFPHSDCRYASLPDTPWSIRWISVRGARLEEQLLLAGLSRACPYRALSDAPAVEAVFNEMYTHFDQPAPSSRYLCLSLLYRLLSLLTADGGKEGGDARIRAAEEFIARHYAEADFGVARLAAMLGLHHNYFSVLYKHKTGQTPGHAIAERRFLEAAKMLRFTDRPIKACAFACGFSDELYFSRAFHRRFGVSPSVYRTAGEYPI